MIFLYFFIYLIPITILIPIFFNLKDEITGEITDSSYLAFFALSISLYNIIYTLVKDAKEKKEKRKPIILCDFHNYVSQDHEFEDDYTYSYIEGTLSNLGNHAKEVTIELADEEGNFICKNKYNFLKKEDSKKIKIINKNYEPNPKKIIISYNSIEEESYSTIYKIDLEILDVSNENKGKIYYYSVNIVSVSFDN